jgi:hypothetical protein
MTVFTFVRGTEHSAGARALAVLPCLIARNRAGAPDQVPTCYFSGGFRCQTAIMPGN